MPKNHISQWDTLKNINSVQSPISLEINQCKEIVENSINNIKLKKIEKIIKTLWFEETEEMKNIRLKLIILIYKKEDYLKIYTRYDKLSEDLINNFEWNNYTRWQIALIIMKAYINLASWRVDFYNEDINDALDYAEWMWDNEAIKLIRELRKN